MGNTNSVELEKLDPRFFERLSREEFIRKFDSGNLILPPPQKLTSDNNYSYVISLNKIRNLPNIKGYQYGLTLVDQSRPFYLISLLLKKENLSEIIERRMFFDDPYSRIGVCYRENEFLIMRNDPLCESSPAHIKYQLPEEIVLFVRPC